MPFKRAKRRANEIEADVIKRNGGTSTREFTNKEVYLLLLDEMNVKLSEHIKFCRDMQERYIPEFNRTVELLNHTIDEMPEKGFCTKTEELLDECYPEGEISIPKKVDVLWYDRQILRWILITSIGALITSLVVLFVGFVKGIF